MDVRYSHREVAGNRGSMLLLNNGYVTMVLAEAALKKLCHEGCPERGGHAIVQLHDVLASLYMFQEVQLPALAPALLVDNNFDGHRIANVLVGGTVHDTIRPSGDFAVQTIFSTQLGCLWW